MDLPGEDVTSTLDKISGKNFTSRSVDELLYKVKRNQQKFGAAVEYNLELLSVADNVLYIVVQTNLHRMEELLKERSRIICQVGKQHIWTGSKVRI